MYDNINECFYEFTHNGMFLVNPKVFTCRKTKVIF